MRLLLTVFISCLAIGLAGCPEPDGGDDDDLCFDASECDWDQFCHEAECEDVFGRSFRVVVIEGTASTSVDWDTGGGAPDPYVRVAFDGEACATSVSDDDFFPSWDEYCTFVIDSGGHLTIDMYDEDLTDDDGMLLYEAVGNDEILELVRGGTFELTSDLASLTFRIDPDF
jgi:hypothetical protein